MEIEKQDLDAESAKVPISSEGNGVGVDKEMGRSQIGREVKKQLWLAGPLVAVSFLQYLVQVISIMFVGHLGELALSGASLATSFAMVTGFSLLMGMGGALETLCGQAYGAKQYHLLGIHMQRAMLVHLLVSIPIACIWANTDHILMSIRQNPEISKGAGLYSRYIIPSVFGFALLQCLIRFLQTQKIVFPMMIITGVITFLHVPLCWVLVYRSGLGYIGAAVANNISCWINVLSLAIYIKFSPTCKRTWTGFSKEAFQGIPKFIRLAVPSAVMVCFEFWSFEAVILMAGLLPNSKLEMSVLSIIHNTGSAAYSFSSGLGNVASTRVSNELGAGQPQAALLAVRVVLLLGVGDGTLLGLAMISLRSIWGYVYSNEEEVVRYVAAITPLLAISIFLDGIQCAFIGIVRGCGRQKAGALISLGAYYLVGIPSAIVFAFILRIGGKGLWLGIVCALLVQVVSLLIMTVRVNWEREALKARNRVCQSTTIPVDMTSSS